MVGAGRILRARRRRRSLEIHDNFNLHVRINPPVGNDSTSEFRGHQPFCVESERGVNYDVHGVDLVS